jgi:hypothetical protein
MWSANRRSAVLATTRHALGRDLSVVATGALLYLAFLMLHRTIFGVSPFL